MAKILTKNGVQPDSELSFCQCKEKLLLTVLRFSLELARLE